MELFVCNATQREHLMHYRLKGGDARNRDPQRLYTLEIPAGGQRRVSGDHSHPQDVDDIIEQLERYGARTADEAAAKKDFSGIIYSLDRAVSEESIRLGLKAVDDIAIERAQEHRTQNAIAADELNAKRAQESGMQVSGLEVDFVEQPRPGVKSGDLNKQTIKVEREGAPRSKRARSDA